MKTAIGLLLASATFASTQAQLISFGSGFSPDSKPLVDEGPIENGSWSGDIVQNSGGYQVVGGLGLATDDGLARSATFSPVDLTNGNGFLDSTHQAKAELTLAPGSVPADSVRLTLHDTAGGLSSWIFTPTGLSEGQFGTFTAMNDLFVGNLDWSQVNRFGLSGGGGSGPFKMSFDHLSVSFYSPVPEPAVTAVVTGLLLCGFGVWRRRFCV